jgi:DNA polymerase-1
VGADSRIHGTVFPCGAGTRRMTHSGPNTANIPSNEAKYGHECRSLWLPTPGRVLVGYDASAAQMRMFGHYLGDPEVVAIYTGQRGDPHQRNADLAGISRRGAKNAFYAFIFGAQDKKLGLMNGGGPEVGARIRAALYQSTPGLEDCVNKAMAEYRQNDGRMRCIDGGYVLCPSPHAALCYLIQSAEGVLMKTTSVMLDKEARKKGIEHWKVGDIHDEAQHEIEPKEADELGKLAVECIRQAGEQLNFKVPMDGGFKVGASWADTH